MGQRYRTVKWKIRHQGLGLASNQDLLKGKDFELLHEKFKSFPKSRIGRCGEQTSVTQTYHRRGFWGGAPQQLGDFL